MQMQKTKRQRNSHASFTSDDSDFGVQSCNDAYNEVLQHGGGSDFVRYSWFNVRSGIKSMKYNYEIKPQENSLFYEIKSLSQQLVQVKRGLWPSAEKCAAALDSSPGVEFLNARAFANPMEALGEYKKGGLNQMFINRSAIKLANIDAFLSFELTIPRVSTNGGTNCFLFADLCGAPGGFSEYIMKRIRSKGTGCACRGYGISLVGSNEHGNGALWRLEDFCQSDSTFSLNYHVFYGSDGTGDLYNWENLESFKNDIQCDLQKAGIAQRKMNLVVADGGFDAQRDSECQEELAQKLIICELAAALELIDCGGTLLLKMFGYRTESMRMAMRSMSDFFDSMEMIKPISSRPASSERYVVLSEFQGLPENWEGGQSWINSVLICNCLQQDISFYSRVDAYLDQFDRDMLILNLKACFAILSYLERKIIPGDSNKCRIDVHFKKNHDPINIKMYKHGWQLFI